ncbi:hypothetical protein [Alicyclobacillus herbarius]|uniref:hypothetical protein n=1 Tax=Alicyclobacillus herbarius TaxID=122960 RepID=UPI0003F57A90|nr:hypothetical protein [Alicyclobacillus herbarius]
MLPVVPELWLQGSVRGSDIMTVYSFLQFYQDAVPAERTLPNLVKVRAKSREQAIVAFCKQLGLQVESDDGKAVWFVREEDGLACQYGVNTPAD